MILLLPTLCMVLLFRNIQGFSREDPVVVTKVGSIRGLKADNGNYTMFMGIPYARVNDTFPFGDTLPVPPFEEVFEAYSDEVRCPQWFDNKITGSLDCLHLNIHVPDSAGPDNLLPVMIYIFGGRFVIGTAGRYLAGPEYLMKHDVIFVSMGYRLGPYGFMCLDIPEVPGNHGLRDQEKAFKWIKENIEYFGGDSSRMTLFGNSAGAMSVGLHLLSNTEKVYRNAILQSGSSFFQDLFRPRDLELPFRLSASLGFDTDDVYEALRFLASVHPHDLLAHDSPYPNYNPCVEKEFPGVNAFLPDYPLNLKHDHIQGLTILQGFTSEESLSTIDSQTFVDDLFIQELTQYGRFNFEGETLATAESIARRFYMGDEEITEDLLWPIVEFLSDYYFIYSSMRTIPRYFEGGVENVYQYVLSYDGTRNYGKISRNVEHPGAIHADCLGYLFTLQYSGVPEPSEEDQITIDRMTTMWTNFAKYNDPTPEITDLIPVKWEPITPGSPEYYMNINTTLSLGKAYQHRRMNFWRLYFDTYAEYELGYNYTREPIPDSASLVSLNSVLILIIVLNLFTPIL